MNKYFIKIVAFTLTMGTMQAMNMPKAWDTDSGSIFDDIFSRRNQQGQGGQGGQGQAGRGQGGRGQGGQGQAGAMGGGYVSGGPVAMGGGLPAEVILALEKEKTKQLELANSRDLALEHERGVHFQVLTEYNEKAMEKMADKAVDKLLDGMDAIAQDTVQAMADQNKLLMHKHHEHEEKMEILKQKGAPEQNKARLQEKKQQQNHEIVLNQQAHENSLKKMAALGKMAKDFVQDDVGMTNLTLAVGGIALGIYASKNSTATLFRYLESIMMKPELVTETSRLGLKDALNPVKAMAKKSEALAKPTYNAEVDQQVKTYVASIKEGAKQGQPFRHALFYGAPGTGKTLLAKTIAKDLGMHYAIINAANISQFSDKDAVLALNAIFDWAEQSQTVLFFDEVDAMAASRLGNVSEQHRKVLNTLLARTGTETKKFLMIGATNEPGLLDAAYMSRMDERIEFGLPDKSTRIELMKQYFKTYIGLTDKPATDASESQETTTTSTNDQTIKLPEDMDAQFHSLAERTEGFSGRELSQLVRAFRAELALTKDKTITPALMHRVIDIKIAQRKNLATYGKIAEVKFASATIPAAVSTTTTTTTQKQRNEAFEEVVKFNQQKHSNKRK